MIEDHVTMAYPHDDGSVEFVTAQGVRWGIDFAEIYAEIKNVMESHGLMIEPFESTLDFETNGIAVKFPIKAFLPWSTITPKQLSSPDPCPSPPASR